MSQHGSPPEFPWMGFPLIPGVSPLPPSAHGDPRTGVPMDQPNALWVGVKSSLQWQVVEEEGFVGSYATWSSPILDLRPELGNAMSERPNAAPIRPFQVARLYMQVDPGGGATAPWKQSTSTTGLRVFTSEAGSITASEDVTQLSPWEDITSDMYPGCYDLAATQPSFLTAPVRAVGVWEPPSSRMRYWRVQCIFAWDAPVAAPPQLLVHAAMY